MVHNISNHFICLKNDIDKQDYEEINGLQDICTNYDKVNLKLELDYRLKVKKKNGVMKTINEFLYYVDEALIAYLGISSFGGNTAELNGMVHPDWRRKGIFTRLLTLAKDECVRRNFEKTLLLCDDKSEAAKAFIQTTGAEYSFSEYKMKLGKNVSSIKEQAVNIRKAKNSDSEEIAKMNCVFFGDPRIVITDPEEEEKNGQITYMVELKGNVIGKIRIEDGAEFSYIYGFGILPEYRGKGFGRQALNAALNIIKSTAVNNVYLDVAAGNSRALNLYKSCGFIEESVMNYYKAI